MSTGAAAYRGPKAEIPEVPAWRIVAKAAAVSALRFGLLVLAAGLLWRVRASNDILTQALLGAVCLSAVYIAMGAGFRVWGVYIVGFVLFAQARAYGDDVGMPVQYEYPITAEKLLFFGQVPTVWLQERLYTFQHLGPLELYTMIIYISYFAVPHIFAFCLWKWDRPRFDRYLVAFMVTLWGGVLACVLVPTAPPWLAAQTGDLQQVYRIVPDLTQSVTPGGYDKAHNVAGLNLVAAMPSLHAAVPCLMAMALWSYRRLRWAGAWYAVSMTVAIVYLGEHYVVDALAGLALAGAAWVGARAAIARWEGRQETGEREPVPASFPAA